MKTEIIHYNGHGIEFALDERGRGLMINATEMARPFGKKVDNFTRSDSTQAFIRECLNNANSRYLNIATEDDLIVSRQKSGTWMHRVLALKFAAWLSPSFELWVYSTIEELLFGRHVRRERSLERTIALRDERDELRDKPAKTGADFERYLEIERELKSEKFLRRHLTLAVIGGAKGERTLFDGASAAQPF